MSKPDFVENGAFSSMIYLHIISYTIDMVEFRGKLWDYQKANPTWGNPKLCWWLDPKFDIGLLKERQKTPKKIPCFDSPVVVDFPFGKRTNHQQIQVMFGYGWIPLPASPNLAKTSCSEGFLNLEATWGLYWDSVGVSWEWLGDVERMRLCYPVFKVSLGF